MTARRCGVGVPAYFHPDREAPDWARLVAGVRAGSVGIVVINPDSGVGAGTDDAYRRACAPWLGHPVTVAGYVDTGYTGRPVRDVLAEAERYRAAHGLTGVFLDRVTSGAAELGYYRELAAGLRARGVDALLLNPGVRPSPGYLDLADVVVTFEGSWAEYEAQHAFHRASRRRPGPASRSGARRRRAAAWHLVHDTPLLAQNRAVSTALSRGAGFVYVTERTLPNPWGALPVRWPELLGSPGLLGPPIPDAVGSEPA